MKQGVALAALATALLAGGCVSESFGTLRYVEVAPDAPPAADASYTAQACPLMTFQSLPQMNRLLVVAEQDHPGIVGLANYEIRYGQCATLSGEPVVSAPAAAGQ